MVDYIEMKMRKTKETVRVYKISIEDNKAMIYSPGLASTQNGNGWQTVKMSALVPVDLWVDDDYCSKTKKNKIKSRLKLIEAKWECTDGTVYTHEYIEDAIKHEAILMNETLDD